VGTVEFTPVGSDGMKCEVRSRQGHVLRVSGTLADIEPHTDGDDRMRHNAALVHNAWAYAKHEKQFRRLKLEEKRASHRKQADLHAKTAAQIADLVDLLGESSRTGWCSACFTKCEHREVRMGSGRVPAYLCMTCGSPTLRCAAPYCKCMANRGFGPIQIPKFCAAHRHDIYSFERASDKVDRLEQYEQLHVFDVRNLTRISRLLMTGLLAAGVIGTGGFFAGPAIGGAIGALSGYSGAAATSYGLALLGGGSVAAGGFGMVGGTYAIAAAGAALGSALGASVTNAYLREDKSFRIEKFRDGSGTPVIVARGFMTQVDQNWRCAIQMIEKRYPDSPIYRLHWGSKELSAIGLLAAKNIGVKQGAKFVAGAAARAGRVAAKKLGPIAPVLILADLAKNPWHTALVRADRTGVALAGILARTREERFILVGHSLGARAMITAAETLATSDQSPRIETIHLLGAAEGSKGDWRPLSESVTNSVYNYFSTNDAVLKFAFAAAQVGSVAVGLRGFRSKFGNIKDRDVSPLVKDHSGYFSSVRLA
jgi:hypothetical protein